MSELDHPIHQRFTPAQMRAIVEVAGMADRVVAAHRHGEPGILAALEAGVRTIEHGTYLDEEAAAAMRETGAPRSGQLAAGYDAAIIIDADPLTDIAVPAKPGTIAGCAGPGGGSKAVPAVAPPPVEHGLYRP